MSITSAIEADYSTTLAKRFAALATSYLDNPGVAKTPVAKVPLENLFRLSEMFRYGAFADERRHGVLAIEGVGGDKFPRLHSVSDWHTGIETALRQALTDAFGASSSEAIDELQSGLRNLAAAGAVSDEASAAKVRTFLTSFQAQLA